MKTPRDILLARHQAAIPKLDAIRQSAVAAVGDHGISTDRVHERRPPTAATMIWRTIWRELIFPSRRIWAGLAVVWMILFAVNFSMRDNSPSVAWKSPPAAEMILAWRQQQQLLAELNGLPAAPADADREKTFTPKPRTERMQMLTA